MSTRILLAVFAFFLLLPTGVAVADPVIDFASERWTIQGREHRLEEHLGRPAILLHGAEAVLSDLDLLDGVLEVDVAFGPERGFSGAFWRSVGPGEREEFYLRPHQSGKPDANQYTPVFHGNSSWQLYHGTPYATPVDYRFDEWQTLRVMFQGGRAAMWLDSEEPILLVGELKRSPEVGKVGVYASSFAPAWFSRFRVRPLREDEGVPTGGAEPEPAPPGIVKTWQVSEPFSSKELRDRVDLPEPLMKGPWSSLAVESTGLGNLARLHPRSAEKDTVLARTRIEVEEHGFWKVKFGYSDAVAVYLNGRQLYRGSNLYRSRDFRYLGTIGLFDEVPFELEPGVHDLVFAVQESFGGWGIQAVVERVGGPVEPSPIALGDDLRIRPQGEGLWLHESDDQWGEQTVSANGLVVQGEAGVVIVDTPWTEEQTARLLDWIEEELESPVLGVFGTHFHPDTFGGIGELHRRGIETWGHESTPALARGSEREGPRVTFGTRYQVSTGTETLEAFYPGPGHAPDNFVVWLPQRKLLFAGCLVKATSWSTLGYLGDADLEEWPSSLRETADAFDADVVIPGHGQPGGPDMLEHTVHLIERHLAKEEDERDG